VVTPETAGDNGAGQEVFCATKDDAIEVKTKMTNTHTLNMFFIVADFDFIKLKVILFLKTAAAVPKSRACLLQAGAAVGGGPEVSGAAAVGR
jgi:hypothetical protein